MAGNTRKVGRHVKRSPSMARYRNESRWGPNARRKQAAHAKRVEADKNKVIVVARGTARAVRRAADKEVQERAAMHRNT